MGRKSRKSRVSDLQSLKTGPCGALARDMAYENKDEKSHISALAHQVAR